MEIKRDLLADMAICDAATEGPLHYMRSIHSEFAYEICERNFLDTIVATAIDEKDAAFITEAREGWVHAIRRALAAEAKWDALKTQIYTDHNELQTCTLAMYELRRLIRLIERLETEGVNADGIGN